MNKNLIAAAIFLICVNAALAQQHQPEYVYIGTANGPDAFSVNERTGSLTPVDGPGFQFKGQVSAAEIGEFAFFAADQGIGVEKIHRARGVLTSVLGSPFESAVRFSATAVSPDRRFLIGIGANALYSFFIDSSLGALTLTGPPVALMSTSNSLVVSPSSRFVYVGGSTLVGFFIDPQTGALTPLSFSAAGSSPVISKNGKHLYSINSSNVLYEATILGYSIDPESGALIPVPGSPFPAANTETLSIAIDPTGRFLYETANDLADASIGIAGFLIDPVSGAIKGRVPGSPFPTSGFAACVVVDLSGNFLYAPGIPINEFAVNPATGSLTNLSGTLQANSPINIVVVAP